MKIATAFLASALAQDVVTTTSDLGLLERGKKKKAAKYAATSTDAPDTTVYTTTTSGGYNDPYAPDEGSNGGGSASYGDPHFHVEGLSADQPDICFDYNLEPGQEMILIDHPSFRVGGELFKPNEEEKGIYFQNLKITTHGRNSLHIDAAGWKFESRITAEPEFDWFTGAMKYGDFITFDYQKLPKGYKMSFVTLGGGPTFLIEIGSTHGNVNFKLIEHNFADESSTDGVLGRFLRSGAYEVITSDSEKGTLVANGETYDVSFHQHARNKNCWVLKDADIKKILG
ncbi:unnamed protein product [Oikopleura dioica]|uniref:Uncharacterized protein n=1 Tax=Oikopleura dioica TaxID=34765 RepID=E4XXE2_OIKDI|nr:unnamed protein product [Oikopleura dioica]